MLVIKIFLQISIGQFISRFMFPVIFMLYLHHIIHAVYILLSQPRQKLLVVFILELLRQRVFAFYLCDQRVNRTACSHIAFAVPIGLEMAVYAGH